MLSESVHITRYNICKNKKQLDKLGKVILDEEKAISPGERDRRNNGLRPTHTHQALPLSLWLGLE
jgi:hypothetical protein